MSTAPSLTSIRLPSLLVSVRDPDEAASASTGGADVIDIKEPSRGPLGAPDIDTVDAILSRLPTHSRVTAALGEWTDLQEQYLLDLARRPLSLLKIGTQNGVSDPHAKQAFVEWSKKVDGGIDTQRTRLIPVAYADHAECNAPSPENVLSWAVDAGSPFLLIDTAIKDGRSVFDHLSSSRYGAIQQRCRLHRVGLALAGSLTAHSLAGFSLPLPEVFAVRGAACAENQRQSAIDSNRVRSLVHLIRSMTENPDRTKPTVACCSDRAP